MDKLEVMLRIQAKSQRERGFNFDKMTEQERATYIKTQALHLHTELGEFLRELPFFKEWKKYPAELQVNNKKSREELIDVLHFMLNICIAMGLSDEDIFQEYCNKAVINSNRLKNTTEYKRNTDTGSLMEGSNEA